MKTKQNLIIYATVDWHARKIAYFSENKLKELNNLEDKNDYFIENYNISDFIWNIEKYDKILIISSVRYWKFHKNIQLFIKNNLETLNSKNTWFIAVNLVARNPKKRNLETNIYTRNFLKNTQFKPKILWIFWWVLDYARYNFFDKIMIKFIMTITKWVTSSKEAIDYTDREDLKNFIKEFNKIE